MSWFERIISDIDYWLQIGLIYLVVLGVAVVLLVVICSNINHRVTAIYNALEKQGLIKEEPRDKETHYIG